MSFHDLDLNIFININWSGYVYYVSLAFFPTGSPHWDFYYFHAGMNDVFLGGEGRISL